MRAELISVGTELLLGQIIDTNATYLARLLASWGVDVLAKQTVGDNLERVRAAVSLALSRSDLVITTGGLGPTEDDLTAEAVALAAGLPMVRHEETAERIAGFFARRGRTPTESVFRQAQIPSGARVTPNRRGTAPGLMVPIGGKVVFMFPGVSAEMEVLVADGLVPWLAERVGDQVIRSRVLRIVGMGESLVEERVQDLVHGINPTVAPLAKLGEVHLRITAKGTHAVVDGLIDHAEAGLRDRLGDAIFGVDEETLQAVVAGLLIERGLTLAIAESCTAGVLASRLTEIPGSSAFLLAGFVAYSNEAKVRDLGVDAAQIASHGAVSTEVAAAMAEGVRARTGARIGVAVTGIAGPDGGTPAKPVGMVCLAIATDAGTRAEEVRFGAEAGRVGIRHLAAQAALNLIRRDLLSR